jgi:hypothetical protein
MQLKISQMIKAVLFHLSLMFLVPLDSSEARIKASVSVSLVLEVDDSSVGLIGALPGQRIEVNVNIAALKPQ